MTNLHRETTPRSLASRIRALEKENFAWDLTLGRHCQSKTTYSPLTTVGTYRLESIPRGSSSYPKHHLCSSSIRCFLQKTIELTNPFEVWKQQNPSYHSFDIRSIFEANRFGLPPQSWWNFSINWIQLAKHCCCTFSTDLRVKPTRWNFRSNMKKKTAKPTNYPSNHRTTN